MKIPYDPAALESYFKDEDAGVLSNQGFMPYLNTFVLNKVGISTSSLEPIVTIFDNIQKQHVWYRVQ